MPANYTRRLLGTRRSTAANQHLGYALAFAAGAINAIGFLAVHRYTSHMTGIVSTMADSFVVGAADVFWSGAGGLLSFLLGATCTSWIVNFGRRRQLRAIYAPPILLEAALLLCFGLLGTRLQQAQGSFVPLTVMLLCFMMGLQNALITKVSRAEIRTTHVTGLITDIGIELGRLLYWNRSADKAVRILADRERLSVLCILLFAFFGGGVVGALGFQRIGYLATLPLAIALAMLAAVPMIDNLAGKSRSPDA